MGRGFRRTVVSLGLTIAAVPLYGAPAAAAAITTTDYGPATWIPASVANYTTAKRAHDYPIDYIIIHDTESLDYAGTIQLFQDPSSEKSAHYVVSSSGAVTQMVAEKDIAYHAGNWDYNTRAIGIEHEGYAYLPGTYTTAEYQASALLIASICSRWGVPVDRTHVVGHSEVPDPNNSGLYGGTDHHTDPGPYWDWTYYLGLAQADANALPSPPHIEPDPKAVGGDTSVTLSWSGRSCHAPITGYQVVGQPGNITINLPGTATSTTITGLTNWTKYTFTVTATDSYGTDGQTSNSVIPGPRLGGILISDPDVAATSSTGLDVVATGTDYALWHKSFDGTQWSAWQSLGGILTSSPAISASAGRTDVYGRGGDGALWHRWWNSSTGWQPWESLGGILARTAGPAAATWGAGRLDVFVRGQDDALWHRWWDGTTWHPWEGLGGLLSADPGAVSGGSGRLDVVVRGVDNALWHRSWDGTTWAAWERVGGFMTSAPAASSCAAGKLDVFANMPDGLWRKTLTTTWSAWQQVDGDWTSGPGATCRPTTTAIELIKLGYDSALWQVELAS